MSCKSPYYFFVLVLLLSNHDLCAQSKSDSSYIQAFGLTNNVEGSIGFTGAAFKFLSPGMNRPPGHHLLLANTGAYAGTAINYHWLSLSFSQDIPNTFVSNTSPSIRAIRFNLRKTRKHFRFEAGIRKYEGLVFPLNRKEQKFDYLTTTVYHSYSMRFTYVFNSNRFSLPSAIKYSVRQQKSAGSFLASIVPAVHTFSLKGQPSVTSNESDSLFLFDISHDPSWISTLVNGGYTYNFVLDRGHWSINPMVMAGTGIQKNTGKKDSHAPQFNFDYYLMLNGGYNGEKTYLYLSAIYDKVHSHLLNAAMLTRNNEISLTFGYRIGQLPRKILNVL